MTWGALALVLAALRLRSRAAMLAIVVALALAGVRLDGSEAGPPPTIAVDARPAVVPIAHAADAAPRR